MKIVNRTAFLALPEGTVFSKYAPIYFGALCIKGRSYQDGVGDFVSVSIADAIASTSGTNFMEKLDCAQASGESLAMDFDAGSRDGLFDADQLFAVLENSDVAALVSVLSHSIGLTK